MKRKRMRLPNGFGQISEIKRRRLRKPFRAMVTVGKTEEGKPICRLLKPVAYFKTYNEAYEALLKYNRSEEITVSLTMDQVFKEWYEEYKKRDISIKSINKMKTYWGYLSQLHEKNIRDVKTPDLKLVFDGFEDKSPNVIMKIKMLLNMMYDYAVMMDYIDKNHARFLKLSISKPKTESPHSAFTKEEMATLWENKSDPLVKAILVQCYMGWRPQELLNIKRDDIDLNDRTITGGSKTEAGTNRVVPIHHKIRPLILNLMESGEDRLIYFVSDYFLFRRKLNSLFEKLNMNHRPHDGRKTFITMAKNKGVDEFAIKRIVGHAIADITENVYTERDIEWLRSEIEKL